MVFMIRKMFNVALQSENKLLQGLVRIPVIRELYQLGVGELSIVDLWGVGHAIRFLTQLTTPHVVRFESTRTSLKKEFQAFHQIALGKSLLFVIGLILFCLWYWLTKGPVLPIPFIVVFAMFLTGLGFFAYFRFRDSAVNHWRDWQWWLAISIIVVMPLMFMLNLSKTVSSVALITAVLLTILVGANGWVVFQSRRLWFELVVVGVLIAVFAAVKLYPNIPQAVTMYHDTEVTIEQSPNEALMAVEAFVSMLGNTYLQRHLLAIETPTVEDAVRAASEYLNI